MKDKKRTERKAREDQVLNRVLWWFGGAVILEFLLLLLNRFYVHFDMSEAGLAHVLALFLKGMVWVSLAAVVGCAVWLFVQRAKGGKLFGPGVCLVISLALLVCSFVSSVWRGIGVQFLYILVPVVAVLALVYYLYQREFFLVALLGGATLFCLWFYREVIRHQPVVVYCIFGAVAAVVLAVVAALIFLQRQKGTLGKWKLFGKKTNYVPMYIGCGVTLCALAAALILGQMAAYVGIFVEVAWLFGAAIYYTVRLM